MKTYLLLIATLLAILIALYPQKKIISNSTGSPGGYTNSSIDNNNCTQCHSTYTLNSGNGSALITSNIPSGGYILGNTYTITATVSESFISTFGFEIMEEHGSILVTNTTETQHVLTGSNRITHKSGGTSGTGTKTWSFNWLAPTTSMGSVTFYGSFVAGNYPNGNTNDYVYTSTLSVNEAVLGCTDSTAFNYNPLATVDDSSCVFPVIPLNYENLFFSEYGEGSSYNKYFEIYNPTNDTIDLINYHFARVSNAPTTIGVYENWNSFDPGALILPYDVYVVAHPSADTSILNNADMNFSSLSNGDDGFALVYGTEPASPIAPDGITYAVLDWIGDWNGDPGTAWDVAGVNNATKDHTLIRKCFVNEGDTSWANAAGTSASNSSWHVEPINYWSNIGIHATGSVTSSVSYTLCSGDSITVGTATYYASGTYIDTLAATNGCDSIIYINLIVLPAVLLTNNQSICSGDSIVVGTSVYNTSGIYTDTLLTSMLCDSIVVTNLAVVSSINIINNHTLCPGDSIIVNSNVYNTAGVFTDTLLSVTTCDSIIISNITIALNYTVANTLTLCSGESVVVGANTYDSSGLYTDVLLSSSLCDSIVTTTLIVLSELTSTSNYTICDGDSLVLEDTVYTYPGTYIDTLAATNGCDSIRVINLDNYVLLPLSIASDPSPAEICLGDTILLEASSGSVTYTWNNGMIGRTIFDNPVVDTWYMVEAVDSNGCSSNGNITVYVDSCITGFEEQSLIIENIFPNPASNKLTISFPAYDEITILKVYSLDGRLMDEKIIAVGQTSSHFIVNDWDMAIYSVYLYQSNKISKNKIFMVIY